MKRADLIAALCVGGLGLLELALTPGESPASVLTVAVMAGPLATRSGRPLASAAVMSSWWLVDRAAGGTFMPLLLLLAPMLMSYTLVAQAPWRRAVAGLALLLASLESLEVVLGASDAVFLALLLAAPAWTGLSVRRHRGRARVLASLTRRLEREQGAGEQLAAAEERRRIAGELHDAIAHAVSRMVLQAGGAGEILLEAPERARAALAAIQATGREAVGELRQSLRTLRAGEEVAGVAPGGAEDGWRSLSWPAWADIPLGPAVVLLADAGVLGHASASELAAMAVAALAVMLRRRRALVALGLGLADQIFVVLADGLTISAPFAAVLISMFTLAGHAPARRAAVANLVATGVLAVTLALAGAPAPDLVGLLVFAGAAAGAALPVRAARRQTEQLALVATRLERERDARARLAALDERARIARELHDSVAHAVSVMVLQAGAAEAVLDERPEQARAATRAIEAHGRAALRELQTLLGVLQDGDAPRAPQPSLRELDELITGAGLPVSLTVTGDPVPLPAGIDVTAYRIIQEALTNALKHAGSVPTSVALDYAPRRLTLDVSDAGGRSHAVPAGAGHGLVGMRERVSLYGGELIAGPRRPGGYAIHAELPLP